MKQFSLIPVFLFFTFLASAQNFSNSNLPIIIINTDINPNTGRPSEIPDNPRVLATMKIIYRADGSRNYLTDQNNPDLLNYNGHISIETRGSSSQSLPKKPYGLTTLGADNVTKNNVKILEMPKENDWILNSIAFDPSLIRNYLSYDLSRCTGNYAARGRFCEVVINGDYKGLYIFMEKLKVDDDRINIVKMTNTDNSYPEITGGYVTKADKDTGGDPIAWTMQSYSGSTGYIHDTPDPSEITTQQGTYIRNQFTSLQNTATAQNTSVTNGYPSIIDVPSFIDYMLISEIASNADSYQYSTYFHKDRSGKLRAGPIWDYDLTYGNDLFMWGFDRSFTNVWQFDNWDNTGSKFWRDLYNNPTFKCYLTKRWKELNAVNGPLNYFTIVERIDQLTNLISEAIPRENQRWGTIPDHSGEITIMKEWIQTRINWLNSRLVSYSSCANPAIPPLVITKINYNPLPPEGISEEDLEFIEITNSGSQTVNLTGIYFSELGLSYQFPAGSTLGAGKSIVLAGDEAAFQQFYGIAPFDHFTRDLSNKSEKIVLADAFGNVIDSVRYSDETPWPAEADGGGFFLKLTNINSDNSVASNWTVSSNLLVGVEDKHLTNSILVYPNPVSSVINVDGNRIQINSFEIYDLSGREIIAQNKIGTNRFTIDVEKLVPGSYILKITAANGTAIVQKINKLPIQF